MKKLLTITAIMIMSSLISVQKAEGQAAIAEIIKEGVKKVIKAVDLKVQRLQTKTIWLQNAQKVLENKLSKLKLDQISGWMEKQRSLYKNYYEALWKVKSVIAYYHEIKEITQKQQQLLEAYHQAWILSGRILSMVYVKSARKHPTRKC